MEFFFPTKVLESSIKKMFYFHHSYFFILKVIFATYDDWKKREIPSVSALYFEFHQFYTISSNNGQKMLAPTIPFSSNDKFSFPVKLPPLTGFFNKYHRPETEIHVSLNRMVLEIPRWSAFYSQF